jgi:hypothetical protein
MQRPVFKDFFKRPTANTRLLEFVGRNFGPLATATWWREKLKHDQVDDDMFVQMERLIRMASAILARNPAPRKDTRVFFITTIFKATVP